MTKRRLFLGILAVALFLALILVLSRPKEPSYNGRSLSQWVEGLGYTYFYGAPLDPEAPDAIRQIGAQAVPHLLQWIAYEPPPWRLRLAQFCRTTRGIKWAAPTMEGARQKNRALWAGLALECVGPEGRKAIPALVRIFSETNAACAYRAAYSLGHLGGDALSPLIAALTNQDPVLRWRAVLGIRYSGSDCVPALPALIQRLVDRDPKVRGESAVVLEFLGHQSELVVPHLTRTLQSPYPYLRCAAAELLGHFGGEAASATPALVNILTDPDAGVRETATNALRAIAPEALTNAPPK